MSAGLPAGIQVNERRPPAGIQVGRHLAGFNPATWMLALIDAGRCRAVGVTLITLLSLDSSAALWLGNVGYFAGQDHFSFNFTPKYIDYQECARGFMRVHVQSKILVIVLITICYSCLMDSVIAQQSRQDEIAQRKAEKARQLKPYEPNAAEKWIDRIERWGFLTAPRGLYPWLGSVYSGGGFSFGPGFLYPYGDTGRFDIHAGWSVSNYKLIDTSLHLPELADQKIHIDINASYIDAPKVRFFGVGNESLEENETNFTYQPTVAGATITLVPVDWFYLGGGYDYLDITTESGDGTTPSIEEIFNPSNTPGLGADVTYDVTRAFAALDFRQSPGYNRRGALLRVDWTNYDEKDGLPFSFQRLEALGAVFIPILRENWVIVFAGKYETTDTDGGDQVPHFLLPKLGGGREVRGFVDYRFQDRHKMVMTAEYRWTPSHFVDMAIFYDLGKVAARRSDLDFEDLKSSYGIGIRFHTPLATVFRFDVAFSEENKPRLIFAFSPSF